eukprot:437414-Alexandrium_andersonii.AAC.1
MNVTFTGSGTVERVTIATTDTLKPISRARRTWVTRCNGGGRSVRVAAMAEEARGRERRGARAK